MKALGMYNLGAVYAAMSGSGSAIFGIFKHKPANIGEQFEGMFLEIFVILEYFLMEKLYKLYIKCYNEITY